MIAGAPEPGEVLHIGPAASVQFNQPILFRVIRVHEWPTYYGWIWLDGYSLNQRFEAIERRTIFVQIGGLRRVSPPKRSRMPAPRGNRGRFDDAGRRTGGNRR